MTVKPRELPKPYTAPLCLEVDPETKLGLYRGTSEHKTQAIDYKHSSIPSFIAALRGAEPTVHLQGNLAYYVHS